MMKAHCLVRPAPPSQRAPHPLGGRIDEVVLKALEKNPDLRYPTAAQFALDLELLLLALDRRGAPRSRVAAGLFALVRPRTSTEWLLYGVTMLMTALGFVAIWRLFAMR